MIVATNNAGKVNELKQIFCDYNLVSLKDLNVDIDVEENQNSFFGNAFKKAKEISLKLNQPTLADDSGICIDAFDGWPGVYTARFLGERVLPRQRNDYILDRMKGFSKEQRKAKIICVLVCYLPDGRFEFGEGIINGYISEKIKGDNGFGFDEIFELEDGRNLAELTKEEKNTLSARYFAAVNLKNKLDKIVEIEK
ncbi:MAG: RdgB/HAM1 family non-canonical purine NTP pyrophosphatase [Clostridia bacterium]